MKVGLNFCLFSGNVGSVTQGKTGLGVCAFSMLVAIDQRNNETIWVRTNVYGSLAKKCSDKINKGDYVVVTGEFMDRKKSGDEVTFLEARAKEIIFESTITNKSCSFTSDENESAAETN